MPPGIRIPPPLRQFRPMQREVLLLSIAPKFRYTYQSRQDTAPPLAALVHALQHLSLPLATYSWYQLIEEEGGISSPVSRCGRSRSSVRKSADSIRFRSTSLTSWWIDTTSAVLSEANGCGSAAPVKPKLLVQTQLIRRIPIISSAVRPS